MPPLTLDQQKYLLLGIPQVVYQLFKPRQCRAAAYPSAFAGKGSHRSDAAHQLVHGIVGGMDKYYFAPQHMRDSDLLAMLGVAAFSEFIASLGDAAQAPDIVPIGQLNGMADMLPIIGYTSISSLCSICSLEQQDRLLFHITCV